MESQGIPNSKITLKKKNVVRRLMLPDFRTHHTTTAVKTSVKTDMQPWLGGSAGGSSSLYAKRSQVGSPVGQSKCRRQQTNVSLTSVFLSLYLSLSLFLNQ